MKPLKFCFFPILWLAIFISCQPSEEKLSDRYSAQIDSARVLINELLERNKTPGMAAALSIDNRLVWIEGFGYSDLENEVPVDPSKTKFRIGSVSKTFTSTALGLLMDQGKIHPDSAIRYYVEYLPEKRYPVTVRQVAGHIAGIRHYQNDEFMSAKHYPTVKEGLSIFQDDSLLFKPGTAYSYSSYGWNLISAVIEEASGENFLNYMQSNVFDKLKMNNTEADFANKKISNRTKFYTIAGDRVVPAPYVDNSYKWAGGGFISTAEDLIKFGQAHLESGLLTEKTLHKLQESQFLANGDTTNYGMGWSSGYGVTGNYYHGHSGGSVGGITQFWMYPEEKIIIAIVSNCSPLEYGQTAHQIAGLFMEKTS